MYEGEFLLFIEIWIEILRNTYVRYRVSKFIDIVGFTYKYEDAYVIEMYRSIPMAGVEEK